MSNLTIPNALTGARLLCSWLVPVTLVSHWNPLYVLVLALGLAVTDLFDGASARLLRQETELGKQLDPIADGVYCASVYAAALIVYFHSQLLLGLWIAAGVYYSWYAWTVSRWRREGRIDKPHLCAKIGMGIAMAALLMAIAAPAWMTMTFAERSDAMIIEVIATDMAFIAVLVSICSLIKYSKKTS